MSFCLVGSEMCIRDRYHTAVNTAPHSRQHSTTQPSTQYHTAVNTAPHSRQHSTTQPSTQYHTAVRSRVCEERGGAQCSVWKPLCLHLYTTLPVLFCQTEMEMNLSLTSQRRWSTPDLDSHTDRQTDRQTHRYAHTQTHTLRHTYTHTHTHTHSHTHKHPYTYTQACARTHTYTHI